LQKENGLIIHLTVHFRAIYKTACPKEFQQQQSVSTLVIPC